MEGETLSSRDLTVIETLHRVSVSPGHSRISMDDKELKKNENKHLCRCVSAAVSTSAITRYSRPNRKSFIWRIPEEGKGRYARHGATLRYNLGEERFLCEAEGGWEREKLSVSQIR